MYICVILTTKRTFYDLATLVFKPKRLYESLYFSVGYFIFYGKILNNNFFEQKEGETAVGREKLIWQFLQEHQTCV